MEPASPPAARGLPPEPGPTAPAGARRGPEAAAPPPSPAPTPAAERRGLLVAGLAFFGALVALVVIATVFAGGAGDERPDVGPTTTECDADDAACIAAQRDASRPGIIPEPGTGRAPTEAGDRGGALQLGLLAVIVGGLGAIAALVVRSSRRARRGGAAAGPGAA